MQAEDGWGIFLEFYVGLGSEGNFLVARGIIWAPLAWVVVWVGWYGGEGCAPWPYLGATLGC